MTEAEIRKKVAQLGNEMAKAGLSAQQAMFAGLVLDLLAQLLVDIHRIADAD